MHTVTLQLVRSCSPCEIGSSLRLTSTKSPGSPAAFEHAGSGVICRSAGAVLPLAVEMVIVHPALISTFADSVRERLFGEDGRGELWPIIARVKEGSNTNKGDAPPATPSNPRLSFVMGLAGISVAPVAVNARMYGSDDDLTTSWLVRLNRTITPETHTFPARDATVRRKWPVSFTQRPDPPLNTSDGSESMETDPSGVMLPVSPKISTTVSGGSSKLTWIFPEMVTSPCLNML